MLDGGGRRSDLQEALRAIIETALGRSCFRALGFYLKKALGEDPVMAFLKRTRG
jgi:hypothetical protein